MKILVSVVIIHWNTPNSLKKLLRSFQSDKKLQVTAVDNNSNKSVSWISKEILNLIDQAKEKKLDAFSLITQEDYRKPLPSGLSLLAEFTPLKYLIPLSLFPRKTLIGGLLFIKRSVLEKLDGWDEEFFLWFEDSDLTKRLYDGGYHVGWIKSDVKHAGGKSFQLLDEKKKRELFFSSMNKYAEKHLSTFGKTIAQLLKQRYVS